MKKIVIGISGKAQHGKDTSAEYLQSCLSGQIVHFADLLKDQAKSLGWDGEKDEGGRKFIQEFSKPIKDYGNWLAKKYPEKYAHYSNNNYYAALLYDEIINSKESLFYIADVRFLNEFELFKNSDEIKFISIRVNRIDVDTKLPFDNGLTSEQQSHASEIELDNVEMDYIIINDTLENLYLQLANIINDLKMKGIF